jgi:predicted restriction endonuclease
MHSRNPRIINIAQLMGRTAASLAMKLVNLASLDPAHRDRGIRGLSGHSHADAEIWRQFKENWAEMSIMSEQKLQALESSGPVAVPEGDQLQAGSTEVTKAVTVRIMQGFFRKVVLAAYGNTCCVTGNPIEDLLVASHILPWSQFPDQRLNPRNGLCLVADFDRAFDRGLITFDDQLRLELSPVIENYLPNQFIEHQFCERAGQPLRLPERFEPSREFLAYHRAHIFQDQ